MNLMLAKNPKAVLDLYAELPSYGETRVEFAMTGATVDVSIFYDDNSGRERSRRIQFRGAASAAVSTVPGVLPSACRYEGIDASGALVEFEYSEAAQAWRRSLPWRKQPIRHFLVHFLAENSRLEVFAEECIF